MHMKAVKHCSGPCQRDLPLDCFARSKVGLYKRQRYCRDCHRQHMRRWRGKQPDSNQKRCRQERASQRDAVELRLHALVEKFKER